MARLIRPFGTSAAIVAVALLLALSPTAAVAAAPRLLGLINTPPVGVIDSYTTPYGTRLDVDTPGVLANDIDLDGDELETRWVSAPAHGILTLDKDGKIRFEPDPGFSGIDTFQYRPHDGTAPAISAVTVTIVVGLPSPTPKPTPTPRPTATPTPRPTPSPTPTPTPTWPPLAIPTPTLPPLALPLPTPTLPPVTTATPRPTPDPSSPIVASPSPDVPGHTSGPSGDPRQSPGPSTPPGAGGVVTGDGPTGSGGQNLDPTLPLLERQAGPVAFGSFRDVGIGIEWIVPSVLITLPGFLLIIIGIAQLFGGLVWLPLARRWLRGDGRTPGRPEKRVLN